MNLEEKCAVNNHQEIFLKDSVSKRHSEELLSPTRRSSRIRKPKIPVNNYCSISQAIEATNIDTKSTELLIGTSDKAVDAITNENHELYSDNSRGTELTNSNQILEKNCAFFQINSDENEKLESMFDDIFVQRYPKTLQTLLPKKSEKDSLEERKFFKGKSLETPNQFLSNGYISNKTNLPTEDVSKVFKIISKPNILRDKPTESKTGSKASLKTYSNKRKTFQQTDVVESFGLPDYPIGSENQIKSTINKTLDAEILDVSEITILDLQHVDEPWIITNMEGESMFPYYEEVRIKAEPDHFRVNGSFLDIIDSDDLETCDINFFTSTPFNKKKIVNNGLNTSLSNTPKNSKKGVQNKVIDIEAIRMNFKKILSKQLDKKDTKLKGIISRKKRNNARHSKNTMSINSDMFVKNDSFTLADKEIEISNSLPTHEKTEENNLNTLDDINNIFSKKIPLNLNKKSRKTTNVSTDPLHNIKTRVKKKCIQSINQFLDSKNKAEINNKKDFRVLRRDKKSLINSNELCLESANTKVKNRKTPKKKHTKTDFVRTRTNRITRSSSDETQSEQRSVTVSNTEQPNVINKLFYSNGSDKTDLKQLLHSSWNLECLHNVHGIKTNQVDVPIEKCTNTFMHNEKPIHNGSKAELLQHSIENQSDKASKTNVKLNTNAKTVSKLNLTKTSKHFQPKLINNKLKNSVTPTKRMLLRSASQENIRDIQQIVSPVKGNSISSTECYKSIQNERIKHASSDSDIVSHVKINLENCNFKINVSNLVSVSTKTKAVRIEKAMKDTTRRLKSKSSEKNICKELKDLRKSKIFGPELKIVITPLDFSQIKHKSPGMFNDANEAKMSSTKRRLRSSKGVMTLPTENQSTQNKLLVIKKCKKGNTFKDSQIIDVPILNSIISDVKSSNHLSTKKTGSMDSSSNHTRLELHEDTLKDNEEFLSVLENDSVSPKNNLCTKNIFVGGEIPHPKLPTDVTKINIGIDNGTTVIVPKKEKLYKNTISEKIEKKSFVDLELSKFHKADEQNKFDEKRESIEIYDKFSQDEGRELKLSTIDVAHTINLNKVENHLIKKIMNGKEIDKTDPINDSISNVFCKESKLKISKNLETNEQHGTSGELAVYSNKNETELPSMNNMSKDISSKLETTIETSENVATDNGDEQPKTYDVEDISGSQNKSSNKVEDSIMETVGEDDVTDIAINECIELQCNKPLRDDDMSQIDVLTNIDAIQIQEDKYIENRLTDIDHIIYEIPDIKGECSIRSIEEHLTSQENIEANTIVSDLKQIKDASQLPGDEESALVEESPVAIDSISSCREELKTENLSLKELTNVDIVSVTTAVANNIVEETKASNKLLISIEINLACPENEDKTVLSDLNQTENQPEGLNKDSAIVEESAVEIDFIAPSHKESIEDNQSVEELTNVDEVSLATAILNNIVKENKSSNDNLITNIEVNLASEIMQDNTVLNDLEQEENWPKLLEDNESTVVEESVVQIDLCHQDLIENNQFLKELTNVDEISLTTVIQSNITNENISSNEQLTENSEVNLTSPETIKGNTVLGIRDLKQEHCSKLLDKESTVQESSGETHLISSCHQEFTEDNQSLKELANVDEASLTTALPDNVKEKSRKSSNECISNVEENLASSKNIQDNGVWRDLKQGENCPKLLDDKESAVVEGSSANIDLIPSCHKELRENNESLKRLNNDEASLTIVQNNIVKERKLRKSNNDQFIKNTETDLASYESLENNTILSNLRQKKKRPKLLDKESTVQESSGETHLISSCHQVFTEDNRSLEELMKVDEVSITTALPDDVVKEKSRKSSNDKCVNNAEENLASSENIQDNESTVVEEFVVQMERGVWRDLKQRENCPKLLDDKKTAVVEESSISTDLIPSCLLYDSFMLHKELREHNKSLKRLNNVDEASLTIVQNNIAKEKKSRKSSNDQFIKNTEANLASPESLENNTILSNLRQKKRRPKLVDKESTVIEKSSEKNDTISSCHKELGKDKQSLKKLSYVNEVGPTTAPNNTGKEKKSRKSNKNLKNTEVNLISSDNMDDNTTLSNLKKREKRPKVLVEKESPVIEKKLLNSDSVSSCGKKLTNDNQSLKNVLNIDEVTLTTVPNNITKEKKTRKSSNDKLNNNLSKKKNSENVEFGSIITRRGRSLRRRSVDQGDVLDEEKDDYKDRLRRCKSVAPCSRNYIKMSKKTNEIDTCNVAEMDDGVRRSNLRRCKSYSQINLNSSSKRNDRNDGDINHDGKKNEQGLVCKRKSNDHDSKNACEKSMDELNIKAIRSDEYLDFQVGDLAWGQIGCHPYWPCLITEEPETGSHKKLGKHSYLPDESVSMGSGCIFFKSHTVGPSEFLVGVKRQRIFYHVRFFGDNGRRAWITKHQIMLYCNKDDLQILRNEKKTPMVRYLYIKTSVFEKWQDAVNEAERVKSKSLREKMAFFNKTCTPKPAPKKIPMVSNDDTTVEKPEKEPKEVKREPLKRKRKEKVTSHEDTEELKQIDDGSPVRKKFKKRLSDDTSTVCEKVEINILRTDVTTTDVVKHENDDELIQNNVSCLRLRVKHQTDEISEIDSKTSSDNTSASLYSMESQKALFKRNNLFRGVSRDKVCQYCLQPGEVLKCKGRCNGSYHVDCATKILQERCYNRRYRRKGKSKTNIEHNDNDSSFSETASKSDIGENKADMKLPKIFSRDYNLRYANKDKNKEVKDILNTDIAGVEKEVISVDTMDKTKTEADEKDNPQITTAPSSVCNTPETTFVPDSKNINVTVPIDKKVEDLRETIINETKEVEDELNKNVATVDKAVLEPKAKGHVQIITVPSSVYNTPPRKTFPPDFKNMTLAEQIDYKMKEIMRKFESKTVYAESSIESSSEERSLKPAHSKHFTRCGALFPVHTMINTGINQIINKDKVIEEAIHAPVITKRNADNTANILTLVETPGSNDDEKSIKPLELVVQKSFVRHVTADCDTESIDDIQEDMLNTSETSVEVSTTIDPKNFKCGFCISNLDPFCFICNQSVSKRGSSIRQKCSLYQCGRFYHPECLKLWPQTQWSLIQTTKHKGSDQAVDSFVCPLHVCHTCASDDPRAATSRCSSDKIVKCLRCPSTYHSTNLCIPAGSSILSSTQIICPRKHRDRSSLITINTTWCFLCSEGGNLICCETCPTSVHPECLPVNLTDDDKFICEDCESGRLPLYDEIVWVKLGKFRWWPAVILFPNEVPINILNIKHATGEFVVKFFGTYDYYWVNRGRSFLFQEGDTGQCNSVKKKVDVAFNTAVEEAVIAHKLKKEFKLSQEAESITSLKPPPYIRIKVNKPVGNVRQLDLDLSSTTACECDPSQPHPCGPDSDCLNRLLLTECSPDVCPAGKRCKNQSFENREYPPLVPYKTQGRGWGLKTLAPIKKGQFVIEYVGELIDGEEYQRRIQKMHQKKEENYYFLTIDKDRMLDAGPKGNAARFMNHCCQPNCETQKWTVSGDTRVGLFATVDIPADTELTFNYNLECVGKEKKVCRCGAPNCSGFIGVKAKQDTEIKKPRRQTLKKKVPTQPIILPPCFICGKKGAVGACNNKICNKTYHLRCLQMTEWPEGNKFICPWHNCNICSKRTIRCCVKCISSFCPPHSEGNIRYDNLQGFVCSTHDPAKMPNNEGPTKLRKKKNLIVTDETAVTSTTSDDNIEDEDEIPLFLRYVKYRKGKKEFAFDSESESEYYVSKHAISVRRQKRRLSSDSQDEGDVSSATLTDIEDDIDTGKRVLRQRTCQRKKKHRLDSIESQNNTAICSLRDNSLRDDSNSELSSRCNELENR